MAGNEYNKIMHLFSARAPCSFPTLAPMSLLLLQVMLAKFRTERCAVKQILCETQAEYRASMQEMLLMQVLPHCALLLCHL